MNPPEVACTPITAASKKHPTNMLCKEKHFHIIFLVLAKPNIVFKAIKYLNAKY